MRRKLLLKTGRHHRLDAASRYGVLIANPMMHQAHPPLKNENDLMSVS
jgi:hypothetical protein